jgi:hypothetical protein
LLIGVVGLIGLAVSIGGSVLAAIEAAEWVGIRPGGWNWQYLPALYGGIAWGVVGFGVLAPVIHWRSRLALFPSIALATLIVVTAAFLLSLIGYGLNGSS